MKYIDSFGSKLATLLAAVAMLFFGALEVVPEVFGVSSLDSAAAALIDDVAIRAAAAFAISKTINAGLSFVQGIAIEGSIVVAGGSVRPASFLEPVNNLFDQFALAMLLVAAVATTIGLLLKIGTSWGISCVLAIALLSVAATKLFRNRPDVEPVRQRIYGISMAIFTLAFLLRIALPAVIALTGELSERYLAASYAEAQDELQSLEAQVEQTASDSAEQSWLNRFRNGASDMFASINDRFSTAFQSIATMISIFFLETVVLPLGLLWIFYRIVTAIFRPLSSDRRP